MAINVNGLNAGALAGLAGRGTPNLNLPQFGVNYGAYGKALLDATLGLQQAQTAQQQVAQQGQFQTGQLGIQQQQADQAGAYQAGMLANQQQQMGISQQLANQQGQFQQGQLQNQAQQLQQQGQFQQGQLGLQQQQMNQTGQFQKGQLAIQAQQNQLEQQKVQFNAMMQMKQVDLAKLGSASTIGLLGMNQYQDNPEKQSAFYNDWVDMQTKKGVVDKATAEQLKNMSPDEAKMWMMQNVVMTGMASHSQNNNMSGMMPGMTNVYGNITASNTNKDKAQDTAAEAGRSLIDVAAPLVGFNPDLYSYKAQAMEKAGNVLGNSPDVVRNIWNGVSQATGVIPTADQAVDLHAAAQAQKSNVLQSIMTTLNTQKGSRFNEQSIQSLAPEAPTIGEDTPESAFSKLVTLYQRMGRAAQYEADLVQKGIPADSDKFHDKVIDFMKTAPVPGKLSFIDPQGNQHDLGYRDVEAFAKGNSMPVNKAIQFFLQNQPRTGDKSIMSMGQ